MGFSKFVEVGRVAYIAYGPNQGKLCVIVNVIDQNRALVDGPTTGVKRQQINFKALHLTKFVIKLGPGARTGTVTKQWVKEEVSKNWEATSWAQKLEAKKRRANLTDFDRFKLMKAKQKRNALVNIAFGKLRKERKAEKVKAAK